MSDHFRESVQGQQSEPLEFLDSSGEEMASFGIDSFGPGAVLHIYAGAAPRRACLNIGAFLPRNGSAVLQIDYMGDVPNRWWRFWYWLLLGWRWEKLNE